MIVEDPVHTVEELDFSRMPVSCSILLYFSKMLFLQCSPYFSVANDVKYLSILRDKQKPILVISM